MERSGVWSKPSFCRILWRTWRGRRFVTGFRTLGKSWKERRRCKIYLNPHTYTHKSYDAHEKWKMLDWNPTTMWLNFQSKQTISKKLADFICYVFYFQFSFHLIFKTAGQFSILSFQVNFNYFSICLFMFDECTWIIRSTKKAQQQLSS